MFVLRWARTSRSMPSSVCRSLNDGAQRRRMHTLGRWSTIRVLVPALGRKQRSTSLTWIAIASPSSMLEQRTMMQFSWWAGGRSDRGFCNCVKENCVKENLPHLALTWVTAFVPPPPSIEDLIGVLPTILPWLDYIEWHLCLSLWQAFSKKCVDRRKEWLTSWLEHRREKRMEGLNEVGRFLAGYCVNSLLRPPPLCTIPSVTPVSHGSPLIFSLQSALYLMAFLWSPSLQSFLYGESTDFITYSDFINKELILFSNMDNERSIPSMVDGKLEHDPSIVVTGMQGSC